MGGDYWGWVEQVKQAPVVNEEPGLWALQSRPQLDSGQRVKVSVNTFHTNASNVSDVFLSSIQGMDLDITGYPTNIPSFSDGLGNWGFSKKHLVWFYEPTYADNIYVAVLDSSAAIPAYPSPLPFSEDLTFFSVTGANLHAPILCRSVPPLSAQIAFLAKPGASAFRNLYFIGASGMATIERTILPSNLRTGASNILYYAFSADGRFLAANVDGRLVIYDLHTDLPVLDVSESYDLRGYQFSEGGSILYHVRGGQLIVRSEVDGWAVDQTISESGTFTNCGTQNFTWAVPRRSPDNNYWLNIFNHVCGGFDATYRSFTRYFDNNFNLISSNGHSAFASGYFLGDFSNDSRWFSGGDGNINGSSWATDGPSPAWPLGFTTSSSTGAFQMRSFQAF